MKKVWFIFLFLPFLSKSQDYLNVVVAPGILTNLGLDKHEGINNYVGFEAVSMVSDEIGVNLQLGWHHRRYKDKFDFEETIVNGMRTGLCITNESGPIYAGFGLYLAIPFTKFENIDLVSRGMTLRFGSTFGKNKIALEILNDFVATDGMMFNLIYSRTLYSK